MYLLSSRCVQTCTPCCHKLFELNSIQIVTQVLHCILRVEVSDGSYMLVSEDVNKGAGGGVHYVAIEQDPGQSPEDCLTTCASKGKPRFYHCPCFIQIYATIYVSYVHLRLGIEMKP
jgi:hypothetical protein